MPSWSIGCEQEFIAVEILSTPENDCGYDWVSARANVAVGSFHADIRMMILAGEMKPFRDELDSLYRNLSGTAEFKTIEDQLYLRIEVNHLGHVRVTGHVQDNAGFGNRLKFELGIDQTYLPKSVAQLNSAIRELETSESTKCSLPPDR